MPELTELTITDPCILEFYSKHPQYDFGVINGIIVDLLKSLMRTSSPSSPSNIDMNSFVDEIENIKQDYIDEIRTLITSNNNQQQLCTLLETSNKMLLDKTHSIMTTIIPKNQNILYNQINESITHFCKTLSHDINNLTEQIDKCSVKEFINHFEVRVAAMFQNMQQPVFTFINASEERITANINTLKSNQCEVTKEHQQLLASLTDVLVQSQRANSPTFHDSKVMTSVLTELYSSAEILQPPDLNDDEIMLKRLRKSNIIVKNFIQDTNIGCDDISLFLQTIDDKSCHGVVLSQLSGISTKKNYQIDIHNNRIVVYVHKVEYSPAKVQVAVDIIDTLLSRLSQYQGKTDNEYLIPKDILDMINNDYQTFLSQKSAIAEVFKEHQKKVLSQIDELKLPALDRFLSTKYMAPIPKPGLKCELCKSYFANNLKALAAHKRGCARKTAK